MLQDRPYMRDSFDRPQTSVVTWLVSAIVAGFLVQSVLLRFFGISFDMDLGLSSLALRSGHVWSLVTYAFLQDTGNLFQSLLQVIGYLLAIYFIGREILPVVGERRFLWIFLSAAVVGGGAHVLVHWRQPELLLGTWPAIMALFIVFACFYPDREFTLLLFFFLPVTVKPKYVALVLVAVDLFGFIFYEIGHAASPLGSGLQYSAHLGGVVVGWIYFRYVHDAQWKISGAAADIELPRWAKARAASKAQNGEPAYKVNLGDRSNLRAEVDRILDKINSSGFGSLSAKEKKILDDARDLIGRR